MSGNKNSGRKPRYLTIEAFNEFLSNHFFHLKVEIRVQSFVVGLILAMVITLLWREFGG